MPNFDETGPAGQGAKTGVQMGSCKDAKPEQRPFDGRGQGMGKGRGGRSRGWRGWFGRGRRANIN